MKRGYDPKVNRFLYGFSKSVVGSFFRYYLGFEIIGKENIPDSGPLIVVSNHTSILDIFAIGLAFKPYVTFPGKREAFDDPMLGIYLRAMGGFPVDRDVLDGAAARTMIDLLRQGKVLGVMPEGTRTFDGVIRDFKPGFVKLAIMTGAPILPIAIVGAHEALAKHQLFPKRSKVTLVVGKLLEMPRRDNKRATEDQVRQIAEAIRQQIIGLAAQVKS